MRLAERLPRETGRDYAFRTIRDNIIRLEVKPGSQISENELAAEMGLSRTPVREALIELSRIKIIETHPQKKSVVSLIDNDLVEQTRFLRDVLECAVVELACDMAQPEDLERLMVNVGLQNFYLDNYYPDNLMALDNEFHDILFSIAKKTEVRTMIQNMAIHFERVRNLALSTVKNGRIVRDHEDIVRAISDRDKETAKALMKQHLNRYKIDAAELRQQYPQYFK